MPTKSVGGYFLVYRPIYGHEAFKDHIESSIFVWMIGEAAFKDTTIIFNNQGRNKKYVVDLKKGQLVTAQRFVGNLFGKDKGAIDRLWKRMERLGMIEVEGGPHYTRITICNYVKYQERKGQDEPQAVHLTGTYADAKRDTSQANNNPDNPDNPSYQSNQKNPSYPGHDAQTLICEHPRVIVTEDGNLLMPDSWRIKGRPLERTWKEFLNIHWENRFTVSQWHKVWIQHLNEREI